VLRNVLEAGTRAPAQVGLLDASGPANPNHPLAGPPELVEANELRRRGDSTAAILLFRKAAEAGSEEAMTSLGLAFLHGEGTIVQPDSGVKWLREAASKGDPRGMNELGTAYLRGQAGPRDLDFWAAHWYKKAADEGYGEAMLNLGNLYREGRGVSQDSGLAMEYYEKAAGAGLVDAMVEAGFMYEEGGAVSPNKGQAICWYDAAADAGSARGRAALARLRN
jgi:uncharacterized protein